MNILYVCLLLTATRAGICVADALPMSASTSSSSSTVWGAVSSGIQMSLRIERNQYSVGDEFSGVVILRNVGNEMISLVETYTDRDFQVIGTTVDGKPAALSDYGKQLTESTEVLGVGVVEIPAGSQIDRIVSISKRFKFLADQVYLIKAKRKFQFPRGKGFGEVESNTVKLKIDPKASSK